MWTLSWIIWWHHHEFARVVLLLALFLWIALNLDPPFGWGANNILAKTCSLAWRNVRYLTISTVSAGTCFKSFSSQHRFVREKSGSHFWSTCSSNAWADARILPAARSSCLLSVALLTAWLLVSLAKTYLSWSVHFFCGSTSRDVILLETSRHSGWCCWKELMYTNTNMPLSVWTSCAFHSQWYC